MTPTISVAGLSRRYRGQAALDDVSLDIEGPSITGLLGRNGTGKTTLMRILAAQEFPSAGQVRILGASPAENDAILRRMVFVREDQAFPDLRVGQILQVASWFHPNWSAGLAGELVTDFGLPLGRKVKKLSRGMRSAVGIVIGLAARAEVTLFDEPYAGLDPVARQLFYDRLLADYAEHPRTVLLSTHLIDEVADLLERVVVLDRGRVVLDAAADDVRGGAVAVSFCVFLFIAGLLSVTRSMPFGLALGVSRRSYYLGTLLLALALAVGDGLVLTGLQAAERSTGGWGLNMRFFQVPYLLSGPWYLTWLTSSVILALLFTYGIWFGLIFRRWNTVGLAGFVAAQVLVLAAGAVIASRAGAWPSVGRFFTTLSAAGLTGVLAVLAAGLAVGGFVTIRRVTI